MNRISAERTRPFRRAGRRWQNQDHFDPGDFTRKEGIDHGFAATLGTGNRELQDPGRIAELDNMSGLWEKPVSHGDILKKVWKHLDLGVLQSKHPFHTPVFGTIAEGGPSLRVVVLRRFWRKPPGLGFHAHSGSPKLSQIRENPSASWVFYHPDENLQVRILGNASIHTDDKLADEQWEATSLFARRCYIGAAPSSISKKPTHGMPDAIVNREPTPDESREGRKNFCVISTSIETVDVMELDVRGHRRSLFDWRSGELEMKWLTP